MANINLDPIPKDGAYPPVETWHPEFCGDMDLVICANGEWVHEGKVIERERMVTLFSRILWRERESYFLVTPAEKVRIKVEDVPFQITQFEHTQDDQGESLWRFYTRTNDVLELGKDCEIELFQCQGEWRPYVSVRHGMWASFHRNVFYQLVEHATLVATPSGASAQLTSAGKAYSLGTFDAD